MQHYPEKRPVAFFLWFGFVYGFFFSVWAPGYFMFWLPGVIIFWALIALTLGNWKPAPLFEYLHKGFLAACVVSIFVLNFWYYALPKMRSSSNLNLQQATLIARHTHPGDLILVAGAGELSESEVYLPYFAKREIISINQLLNRAKLNKDRDIQKAAFLTLHELIQKILQRGGHVYMLDELMESDPVYDTLSQRYQLNKGDFIAFLGNYTVRPGFDGLKGTVWELKEKE
jgi:hypothetical protein